MSKLETMSDGELIGLYRESRDQNAMRTLVDRHYVRLNNRFSRELRNAEDAQDCSQKLWMQVVRNLDRYEDEGKFPHYLSTIATNIIKGHRRDTGTRERVVTNPDRDGDDAQSYEIPVKVDPERQHVNDEIINLLTHKLIPELPPEQRMAWLLRHESEYWEPGTPLEWGHLAELSGMTIAEVWEKFELAREKLMCHARSGDTTELDSEEMAIFLIWTQAKRAYKEQSFSWDYFAKLIGVPVNTMKTRYRVAQQRLAAALDDYAGVSQ